ncbi:hypothetical protein TNCV_193931 [Trichonephila clavipes]|nr:hypothetical protein TNCV_193931 [Trichonephila clavipes]
MRIEVFEDPVLSTKCAYELFTRFREGWESVPDNSRSKRPANSVSDENIVSKLKVRAQYAQQGSWFYGHDNTRIHTANIVKQFLGKRGEANSTSTFLARSQSS